MVNATPHSKRWNAFHFCRNLSEAFCVAFLESLDINHTVRIPEIPQIPQSRKMLYGGSETRNSGEIGRMFSIFHTPHFRKTKYLKALKQIPAAT